MNKSVSTSTPRLTWELTTGAGITASRLLADGQATGWKIRATWEPFEYQCFRSDNRAVGFRFRDLQKAMEQAESLYLGSLGIGAYAQREVTS